MKTIKHIIASALVAASLFTFTSCSTNAGTGALLGGAGGAGLGALIDSDNPGRGAVIGGGAGAVTGALVGRSQDDRNRARYNRGYYR